MLAEQDLNWRSRRSALIPRFASGESIGEYRPLGNFFRLTLLLACEKKSAERRELLHILIRSCQTVQELLWN
ncbi:hypothetical protein Pla144_36940 [Bythopirellula polymerisocia]|uniref:Uncharacterized protein n=1 Tax=Bythopirellula polymerisocia TaxID=2528003 RepID=A0A5C6CL19_9BACT|nr:hypothetical protein Pla144_36940 [Bythopirellula polymerisocia]